MSIKKAQILIPIVFNLSLSFDQDSDADTNYDLEELRLEVLARVFNGSYTLNANFYDNEITLNSEQPTEFYLGDVSQITEVYTDISGEMLIDVDEEVEE
jgi:hypothetical protein